MRKRNELGLATIGALCDGVQIGREDQGASLAALCGPWRGVPPDLYGWCSMAATKAVRQVPNQRSR